LENYQSTDSLHYEIIVIDDGSTDRTGEIASLVPQVKMIKNLVNKGYGASLKSGIRKSNYGLIGIIDGDGSYDPNDFNRLLSSIIKEDYDMVVGMRTSKNAKIPLIRKPAKFVLKKLVNYLMKEKIPDFNSGLRVFKKNIAEELFDILPAGFSFTMTLTMAMISKNYLIKYEKIEYYKRIGFSKINPIKDTINFISLILRTILYFNPLKIFVPLSLFLFALAIAVLLVTKFYVGKIADVTVTIIVLSAIQILAIGLLADLIDRKSK